MRLMFAQGKSDEQMADSLQRTVLAVLRKRARLHLLRPTAADISVANGKKWTEDEDLFIENYWREKTDAWMARKLGVSKTIYVRHRRKRGFLKTWEARKDRRKSWKWSEEQFLLNYYHTHSAAETGRRLGRTTSAIHSKALRLGCKKRAALCQKEPRRAVSNPPTELRI